MAKRPWMLNPAVMRPLFACTVVATKSVVPILRCMDSWKTGLKPRGKAVFLISQHQKGDDKPMYIAMNRFKVKKGEEAAFEAVWQNREIHIHKEPGFVRFAMLKGPEAEDHTLYVSHTTWTDEQAFLDWTRSQSFRDAHKGAGQNKPLYLGHPNFEGFSAVEGLELELAEA